jgi:DNA-binding winged helix-turn-helix (wHTH) protein
MPKKSQGLTKGTGQGKHRPSDAVSGFGDFRLDLTQEMVFREGRAIHLRPKAFAALKLFYERINRFVTYQELRDSVWGKGFRVEDKNIVETVGEVRDKLGNCRRWIVTRPNTGYGLFVPERPPAKRSKRRAPKTSGRRQSARVFVNRPESGELNQKPGSSPSSGVLTPVVPMDENNVFSYPGGHASAIRLYGRADAYISPERLFLEYEDEPYELPKEMRREAKERIDRLTREAREHNRIFFNGPCARLLRWHHNQHGAPELDTLELVLGPVGWYQFEGTNGVIRDQLRQGLQSSYKRYVDLQTLQQDGDLQHRCKLSNMIGNAVTIFTSDGKVGYQQRGQRQSSVPGLLTSAVAENVNRYKDEVSRKDRDSRKLVNPVRYDARLNTGPDDTYRPKGIPHLVAAVRRGIQEETSPILMDYVGSLGIKLTGLAFGLDNLHPDALWIVLMDLTAERFKELRRDYPGKDAFEGDIEFVPATLIASSTQDVLRRPDWVPAGKASLIRAIQLIGAINPRGTPSKAFDILASAR